jgi:hypothetical protein
VATRESQTPASRLHDALARHEVLSAGVACGIAGGVAMMAIALLSAVSAGLPAAQPLELIGASLADADASGGTAARVTVGTLVHLATSAALGVVIASLLPRDFPLASATLLGTALALLAMALLASLVVPLVSPTFPSGIQPMGGGWVIAHALYGFVLGLAPGLRRHLGAPRGVPSPLPPPPHAHGAPAGRA